MRLFAKRAPSNESEPHGVAARLSRTVLLMAILVASLLTFPGNLPLMIAGWLLWSMLRVHREKPAWPFLIVCVMILLVKRPAFTASMSLLMATMTTVAIIDVLSTRKVILLRHGKRWWLTSAMLGCAWLIMLADWHQAAHRSLRARLHLDRPVACVGDSLTSGIEPYGGYPTELQKLLAVPVVNFGRAGITSGEALRDLPDLLATNPQAVVIELGGHDFLTGRSRDSTWSNLEAMILACREIGAEVILMEIPRGFITDPFGGIERKIASTYDVEIISDAAIRKLVLWSPMAPPGIWTGPQSHLSDDGLHPNRQGNVHLAKSVANSLKRVFGSDISETED